VLIASPGFVKVGFCFMITVLFIYFKYSQVYLLTIFCLFTGSFPSLKFCFSGDLVTLFCFTLFLIIFLQLNFVHIFNFYATYMQH